MTPRFADKLFSIIIVKPIGCDDLASEQGTKDSVNSAFTYEWFWSPIQRLKN